MSNSQFRMLKQASGSEPGLVSPQAWNALLDYVADLERRLKRFQPKNSPSIGFNVGPDGFTARVKRPTRGITKKTICPFGEIITVKDDPIFTKAIRGGIAYAGDKNFNVPYRGIDLSTNGEWLIWLRIEVEVNRDDDEEIILPGIATSSETSPSSFWEDGAWSEGTQYPDNENPAVADGLGEIVIPIGKLTVEGGIARLEAVACGNIRVDQCAGILSHTRL